MSYEARNRDELARRVLGAMIARSQLSDTSQGSVIDTIAGAFGAVAAGIEQRIEAVRDAYDFRNATGSELDERLLEFPPHTITRKPAQRARGNVAVSFELGVSAFTISAGTTFSRQDNGVVFTVLEDTPISNNTVLAELNVEASVSGVAGNAPSGSITIIEDAPNEIAAVSNPRAITTGADEESDGALKRRAMLYLQSLAKCQPSAIEFAALSEDLPLRLTLANLYEPPDQLGYSELLIEDGSGTLNEQRTAGRVLNITAPTNGLNIYYHDAPATDEVIPAKLIAGQLVPLDPSQFVSIPERGIIYISDGVVIAGDVLTVQPYEVFTGSIQRIQRLIEGDPNHPESSGGYRAAGTRIRVLSPNIQRVSLDIHVVIESGIDSDLIKSDITEAVVALASELRVNQPLFSASIIDVIMDLSGVLNVHLYPAGLTSLFEDRYPPRGSVCRIGALNIRPIEE